MRLSETLEFCFWKLYKHQDSLKIKLEILPHAIYNSWKVMCFKANFTICKVPKMCPQLLLLSIFFKLTTVSEQRIHSEF